MYNAWDSVYRYWKNTKVYIYKTKSKIDDKFNDAHFEPPFLWINFWSKISRIWWKRLRHAPLRVLRTERITIIFERLLCFKCPLGHCTLDIRTAECPTMVSLVLAIYYRTLLVMVLPCPITGFSPVTGRYYATKPSLYAKADCRYIFRKRVATVRAPQFMMLDICVNGTVSTLCVRKILIFLLWKWYPSHNSGVANGSRTRARLLVYLEFFFDMQGNINMKFSV